MPWSQYDNSGIVVLVQCVMVAWWFDVTAVSSYAVCSNGCIVSLGFGCMLKRSDGAIVSIKSGGDNGGMVA